MANKKAVPEQENVSTDRYKEMFFKLNFELQKVMMELVERNEQACNEDPTLLKGIMSAYCFTFGIYILDVREREEVKRLMGILVDDYFDKFEVAGR